MIRILYILRNFLLESKRIIIWKIYLTNKLLETNFISTKLSSREYLLKFKYTLSNCNCDIISIKIIFFIKKKKKIQDPQPPEPWTGVKDTSDVNEYICSQIQDAPPLIIGNEDCLYLNVYTNSLSQSKKSVMFWIHDGAFTIGSSSFQHFRPDYLLAKDVVVVTTNYRLGAFGQFSRSFIHLSDLQ